MSLEPPLGFSLRIRGLVPAVPRESLCPTHAPSTPVAARPVIRHPAGSSQDDETILVSAALEFSNDASSEGIAVGTAIAGRPPHRSGLAQLRHPAPTLGV